jgi:hypothetical protein
MVARNVAISSAEVMSKRASGKPLVPLWRKTQWLTGLDPDRLASRHAGGMAATRRFCSMVADLPACARLTTDLVTTGSVRHDAGPGCTGRTGVGPALANHRSSVLG